MPENRFKIRISRLFRSSLGSCKSKDQITDVAVDTKRRRQRNHLIELFSPKPRSLIFSPMAENPHFVPSPELNGRKCPPASPIDIISPINGNALYLIPREKKKVKSKRKGRFAAYKKHSGFEDLFPECRYNGLFSSDEDSEEESRRSSSAASSRRRKEAEAAVEDSLAVVKRSSDPYSDFRTSMVEMIVEKQIFAAEDLENLLQCFLSLNSHHHHQIIIQVFAEICEAFLL